MAITQTLAAQLAVDLQGGSYIANISAKVIGDSLNQQNILLPDTDPHSLSIPGSDGQASFIFILNLGIGDPTVDTQVTITWTPNGGVSASVVTLQLGEYLIFAQGTPGANGITAISLQASVADTTVVVSLLGGAN